MSEITFIYDGEKITAQLLSNTIRFYAVAPDGRLFKLTQRGPRLQRGCKTTHGYLATTIDSSLVFMHRVICAAYHGPQPTKKHEVAHYDGDKLNNHPSNLRWATRSENNKDAVRHGTSSVWQAIAAQKKHHTTAKAQAYSQPEP